MRRPLCYLCLAFFVTVFLYLYVWPPESALQVEEGGSVIYAGRVYQKEYKNDTLLLYLENVQICQDFIPDLNLIHKQSQNHDKKIICYMQNRQEPKLGSIVLVEGMQRPFLQATNPGEFDQAFYWQIQKVKFAVYKGKLLYEGKEYFWMKESLYQLRRRLESLIDTYFSAEDAGIVKAMLLGNKSELSQEKKNLFQSTGIAHILAISGVHISIIGMGLYKLLKKCRVSQWISTTISITVMCLYGEMVGMSCSALRAIAMFIMQMLAIQWKRTYDVKTAVAIVATGILLEQPLYVFHAGFLLSFGAVLGICCFTEVFQDASVQNKVLKSLRGGFCVFIIQFPVIIHFYGSFPVLSLFLNVVIIPIVTFILLLGISCVILGFFPVFGKILAYVAAQMVHLLLYVCEYFCDISTHVPFSTWITGEQRWWKYAVYYGTVFFLLYAHHYMQEKYDGKLQLSIPIKLMTVFLAVMCFTSSTHRGLEITFLDIGQGDCIYIRNENGNCYLLDGGSSTKQKAGQYVLAPFLKYKGIQNISAVFLTHMDQDHVGAILELLENEKEIQVQYIVIPVIVEKNENYIRLVDICKKRNIACVQMGKGNYIQDAGLTIRVLHPDAQIQYVDNNAASFIMQLEYGNFHALFTGDAEETGEKYVMENLRGWKCDVLKVAHHGSKYSSSLPFLEMLSPKIAVISSGKNNTYGHPHMDTLQRLEQVKSKVYRTDCAGAITIQVSKKEWKVTTFRK